MFEFIESELTTVAFCWQLGRRDGVCVGFTTHDRDLVVDDLRYRAAPGMLPSAISVSDGFDLDTLDAAGALSSDAITAADLEAGRWDGARVEVFIVDWQDPGGERIALARGELGDVAAKGRGFETELRGPTALLDRPVAEQTAPGCRARLGDKRCRVDMAARVAVTRISAVVEEDVVEVSEASAAENAYSYGRLRWLSGANSGLDSALLTSDGNRLRLREPPHFPVMGGELVEIAEGCDKSLAVCSGRFANVVNFRGEPHLPGMDLLTRYPGA